MPGFAAPACLLLIPPLLAVLAWYERRKKTAFPFSDLTLFDGLPHGRAKWAVATPRWLRAIAIVMGVAALAGPRIPDRRTRLPAEGIAIVLAIDVSGSMSEKDFPEGSNGKMISRIEAAKLATTQFVRGEDKSPDQGQAGRPNDSMGLVAFAAWPDPVCPLTLNHSVLLAALEHLRPKSGVDAGTNIGDAIAESLIRLEAAGNRRKVLILLTDGEHNISLNRTDPPLSPRQAAQLAHDLQIPIYTIDCGGFPRGDAETVQRRIDGQRTLHTVAEMT
jgi:Ca-activated chloride channel family protein